jgi:hypothetical protein
MEVACVIYLIVGTVFASCRCSLLSTRSGALLAQPAACGPLPLVSATILTKPLVATQALDCMLIAKGLRAFVASDNDRATTAPLAWGRAPLAFVGGFRQQLADLLDGLRPIRALAVGNEQIVSPVRLNDGDLGVPAASVDVDDHEAVIIAIAFFLGLLDAGQKFFHCQVHVSLRA